ncbi:MAG: hypothetical protein JW700_03010 [Candidatus Aenigmarchaeota archaeon]|nr:hypothetical protein [Candidatus Aenigmarchaeota archaeon]
MEFKILQERDNPVLKRKEIVGSLDYGMGCTPSKAALQKHLSEKLKSNADSIEITKIISESGMAKGTAWVKVWQEKKIELYKTKKGLEEAPKEETPKEEAPKAEEKPAEQPKAEEKPKEEKPEESKDGE